MRRRVLILVTVLALCLSGCATVEQGDTEQGPDRVIVASVFPLADITREIAGDRCQVTTLLPSGSSPHTFELTPGQVKELSRAVLLVQVGAGLDDWAAKAFTAAAPETRVVRVTDDCELLAPGDNHEHHHGTNPHVWLDPVIVREHIVPMLAEALCRADPAGEQVYRSNAARFQKALSALDQEIAEKIRALPDTKYISFHNAWSYYAKRYGLVEAAVIEDAPGKEPSARWMTEVVELARDAGVGVIFAEPQLSPKAAEVLAAEFGGRVMELDPLGGEGLPGRESYLDLMRYNTGVFVEALQ